MGAEKLNVIQGGIAPKYDGDLIIATGKSRFESAWQNRTIKWSALLVQLKDSQKTKETHAAYMAMAKSEQDLIKDVGGFVGGHLREGKRRNGYVEARQIITLDIDYPSPDVPGDIALTGLDFAYCLYSTHKYSEKSPRYRLIIPADRTMSADEYEAAARQIASLIDIEIFDDTTFQPTRLMYWPSHSSDVKPVCEINDAPWLSVDDMLGRYPDWTDVSYWPTSSRVGAVRKKQVDRAGDPLTKAGLIGAFNRAYRIPEAIEAFLPDVYTATAREDRYTYAAGSTAMGLVVYEDGLFAYSNHSTDPAGGQLCNAFDLVRIHKFGEQDKDAKPETPVNKLPSFKAMQELVRGDSAVKAVLLTEAAQDFDAVQADDGDWRDKLAVKKDGSLAASLYNAYLIIKNDPSLHSIQLNVMSDSIEACDTMPWAKSSRHWSNNDTEYLYTYVSLKYGVEFPREKLTNVLLSVAKERGYHPIKDYLEGLPEWDGVQRVDTLLVDYLGAEDNIYVREATRKMLIAAIRRLYHPGVKFDCMLVLVGGQGIGKTTFFDRIGGEWKSDDLTMSDMRDKAGSEKMNGAWIFEVGEMAGMRKVEIESVKAFISRRVDEYRPAYGRVVEVHPRQCILVGSTNASGFLRDITGNRRFWPVACDGVSDKNVWDDLTQPIIDQVWAEARTLEAAGEELILSPEAEALALQEQVTALESDPRQAQVEAYLEHLLPEGWETMGLGERRDFLRDSEDGFAADGTVRRTTVTNMEIWCECLGMRQADITRRDADAITLMMAKIPGWVRTGGSRRIPIYGKQRVYERGTNDAGTNERAWNDRPAEMERGTSGTVIEQTLDDF